MDLFRFGQTISEHMLLSLLHLNLVYKRQEAILTKV